MQKSLLELKRDLRSSRMIPRRRLKPINRLRSKSKMMESTILMMPTRAHHPEAVMAHGELTLLREPTEDDSATRAVNVATEVEAVGIVANVVSVVSIGVIVETANVEVVAVGVSAEIMKMVKSSLTRMLKVSDVEEASEEAVEPEVHEAIEAVDEEMAPTEEVAEALLKINLMKNTNPTKKLKTALNL